MTKGTTKTLKVTVKPAAAKKSVSFKSNDKKIVTVSKNGKLTAKDAGTTKIVVTVKGVNKKTTKSWVKIKVVKKTTSNSEDDSEETNDGEKVNDPETDTDSSSSSASGGGSVSTSGGSSVSTSVTVQSKEALIEQLKSGTAPKKIIFDTEQSGTIILNADSVNASNTELVVNAPNATIDNHLQFNSIQINAIAENTWNEYAQGNTLDIQATNAHIVVGNGASNVHIVVAEDASVRKIELENGASDVKIENNGSISQMTVFANTTISLSGINKTIVPVDIAESVTDTTFRTAIPVEVNAAAKITLQLEPGAEVGTSVVAANTQAVPEIEGLGTIQVTNKDTNDIEHVIATTNDELAGEQKAEIIGKIVDSDGSGVKIYFIPYSGTAVTAENVDEMIQGTNPLEVSSDGVYSIKDKAYGNYVLVVKADYKQTYIQNVLLNDVEKKNDDITLVELSESASKANLSGSLIDAVSGKAVTEELTVNLRQGAGNVSGDADKTTTFNTETGTYEFADLPVGTYTVQVLGDTKYIHTYVTVTISSNEAVVKDITVGKIDTENKGQIQFVLNWAAEAEDVSSDLDSHLVGPSSDGSGTFHTYYIDMEYDSGETRYADLDVDDVDYEGPETTTVRTLVNGEYHFYVFDYADQDDVENTKLTTSKAVVRVYIGNSYVTYNVPNGVGNIWDVCTYDSETNTLTPINKIYYHVGGSSTVGNLTAAKEELQSLINTASNIAEAKDMVESAKKALDSGDYQTMMEAATKLLRYKNVTKISNVTFEGIDWYDTYTDESTGLSILKLYGRSDDLPDDIVVTLYDENSTYKIENSGRDDYLKKITVTNSKYNLTEEYYVLYEKEQYDAWAGISEVSDGDNSVYVYTHDRDEDGNLVCYLRGTEKTLSENAKFTCFVQISDVESVNVVSYSVNKLDSEDSDYDRIVKVTYNEKTYEIYINYTQVSDDLSDDDE